VRKIEVLKQAPHICTRTLG